MKKLVLTLTGILIALTLVHAQKFAYVDSQYILDNLPEFTEAQAQLDELSAQWQKEIEVKFADLDKMYRDYQTQAVLLPEDMKKKKEQEIADKEKEAKALQKQRFGVEGDLFKKRQELVKPIQEKIYNALQEICNSNNYMIVFDKAGSLTMLYANPKYDISDQVLDNLGAAMSGRKSRTSSTPKSEGSQPKVSPSNNPVNDQKPSDNEPKPGSTPPRPGKR